MAELAKGANTLLGDSLVRAALRSGLAPGQIEVCAMLVSADRRVRGDHDFVFFNQERSGCGSARRLSAVELEIDLSSLPTDVDAVIVAASLDDDVAGSIAAYGGGFVIRDGRETISHAFDGLTTERCVIAAEIYRRGGAWKLRAVSQGYDDLDGLVRYYGVETEASEPREASRSHMVGQSAPARQLPSLPIETPEIIDRVRRGSAARRTSPSSRQPHPAIPASPRRGSMPAMQYRSLRHREADLLTTELQRQARQLRAVLQGLPHPDLSPRAVDAILDASVPRSSSLQWLRFGRREQLPAPSETLRSAVHRLRSLATDPRHEAAVEAWVWLSIHATALQPSFGHAERVTVQTAQQRIVLDVAAPARGLVPSHARVQYRVGADRLDHQPLPERERIALTEVLFGAAALAHAHVVAVALGAVGLPADELIVTNVWEWRRDPASGQQRRSCRCSLLTTPQELARIHLPDVDAPVCIRSLGGATSATEDVTPQASGQRSTQHGRRLNLTTIDPYEFENLIVELAEAMGYAAYGTPRSGDHGVDVFVESTDTLANGRIVISAKRFNSTVGPDHVRALDAVVREQGAIKGILITTSRFGPESIRFAQNKPLELVDGERLRQWLTTYLDIKT